MSDAMNFSVADYSHHPKFQCGKDIVYSSLCFICDVFDPYYLNAFITELWIQDT